MFNIGYMHVDQVFGSAISAKRDFPSIIYDCFWEGTSRDTCTCIYVYISRTSKLLRRLDPVGIIYRLARTGPLLGSSSIQ